MAGDGAGDSAVPLMGVVCGRSEVFGGNRAPSQLARKEPTKGPSDWKRERINTELLTAVQNNQLDEVKRLLEEEEASPNSTCRKTRVSVAHIACSKGYVELLKLLIKHKCRLDKRDNQGFQPVHYAAWEGHRSILETLYSPLVNVNMWAKVNRDLKDQNILECLDLWSHDHGSTLNPAIKDVPDGSNILHLACRRLHWRVLPLIMEFANSDVINTKDKANMTPLEVVGISVDLPTFRDLSIELQRLATTADAPPEETSDNCATKVTSYLVEKGARVSKELSGPSSSTPEASSLDPAVVTENIEIIKMILESNPHYVKRLNKDQETVVHSAIRHQSYKALKTIVEMVPEATEVRNALLQTPLLVAVKMNLKCGVSTLLEYGADVTARDCQGNNALHIAAEMGYTDILEELLLSEKAVQPKVLNAVNKCLHTPISIAVFNRHLDCLMQLEAKGADVFTRVHDHHNLLHLATQKNSPDILEYLLNSPLKANVDDVTYTSKETPLLIAAMAGYDKCAIKLIEGGANISAINAAHSNVLHLTSQKGHASTVKCILEKSPVETKQILLAQRDSSKQFPLHVAAIAGHRDCVSELIKGGANLADKSGPPDDEKSALALILPYVHRSSELLEDVFDSSLKSDNADCTDAAQVNTVNVDFSVLVPNTGTPESRKILSVLETIIMDCKDDALKEKLLLHPLTSSFMYLMWRKLRLFYWFLLFIQICLTVSLSVFVYSVFTQRNSSDAFGKSVNTFLLPLVICLIVTVNVELLRTFRKRVRRKFDSEVCLKWILCFLTFIMLLTRRRDVASIAVFLSWIELLLLISHCVPWGIYVQMFTAVAKSVTRVIVLFSFAYAGFTFFFFTFFNGSGPFSTFANALMKTFIMSNELEYESTFENFTSTDSYEPIGHVFFGMFMFYISIALMNLCIGLAVNDIGRLTARGKMERLIKRVDLLTLLDVALCPTSCQWILPRRLKEYVEGSPGLNKQVEVRSTLPSSGEPHSLPPGERSRVFERFYSKKKRSRVISENK